MYIDTFLSFPHMCVFPIWEPYGALLGIFAQIYPRWFLYGHAC